MFKWLGSATSSRQSTNTIHHPSEIEGKERYFGLENGSDKDIGSYCNSVLQALYFCRPFRECVVNYPYITSLGDLPPASFFPGPCETDLEAALAAFELSCGPAPGLLSAATSNGATPITSSPMSPSTSAAVSRVTSPNTSPNVAKSKRRLGGRGKNKDQPAVSVAGAGPAAGHTAINVPPLGTPVAPDENMMLHLRDLFVSLSTQKKRTGVFAPRNFINKIKRENVLFRTTQQQDSHEFLNYFLNALAEVLIEDKKKDDEARRAAAEAASSLTESSTVTTATTSSSGLGSGLGPGPNESRPGSAAARSAPDLPKEIPPAGSTSPKTANGPPLGPLPPPIEVSAPPAQVSAPCTHANCATQKTWIHELFEGELATEIRCMTCQSVTQTRECFLDLSIDVEANSSISSCLWNFSQPEMLCQDDKFYCDTCVGLQEAERVMKIKKMPPILALHLKRFKFMEQQQKHVKLMHRVVFPTELRIFNSSSDPEDEDREYDLFAIVVHIGSTPNHGHYVALIRSCDRWLLFDDDSVELVQDSHIAKYFGDPEVQGPPSACASGYIFFYQARDIARAAVERRAATGFGTFA